MDEYFQILGITPNSTHAQIKKAYRKLAMHYHPDINPSADAHEKFLKITEAYEVLTGIRKLNNPFKKYYYRKASRDESFRKETARERAHRHAQMQYEEFCRNNEAFQKSWYYRPAQVLVMTIYFLGWIFGFFLMLTPLLAGYYIHMKGGFWWQGFLFLPLILAGPMIIYQSLRLKKEASPYFKDRFFK